jgi:hypothetical protein
MPRRAGTGNNGKLQATILKKCSTGYQGALRALTIKRRLLRFAAVPHVRTC